VFAAHPSPWGPSSIWPAAGERWGRELWPYDRARRGWIVPPSRTYGTVLELGVTILSSAAAPARTHSVWYGVTWS
jgi:hypothetical protein